MDPLDVVNVIEKLVISVLREHRASIKIRASRSTFLQATENETGLEEGVGKGRK